MLTLTVITPLIIAGAFAGLLAGLLGLGGGIFVVPIIVFTMKELHPEVEIQHVAVATSFAIMVFTSFSSALTHYKLHNIRFDIFKHMVKGVIAGTLIGSVCASFFDEKFLRYFFIVFTFVMSIFTFYKASRDKEDVPSKETGDHTKRHIAAGGFIGLISSWLGIGGGGMTVPYLLVSGVSTRNSVGTGAILGWPVGFVGAIIYLISGIHNNGISSEFLGWIYVPGFIIITICTVIFAPIGAKISNFIPPKALTFTMALAFLGISMNMLYGILT